MRQLASTIAPGSTAARSSGSSTNPSAATMEDKMPAPSRGNLRTDGVPSSSVKSSARSHSRRLSFFL